MTSPGGGDGPDATEDAASDRGADRAPEAPRPPTAPLTGPPVPDRPYARPTGWTGGSPTSVPGTSAPRPAATPGPAQPAAGAPHPSGVSLPGGQGVPSRPQPLPPPRPTPPRPTTLPSEAAALRAPAPSSGLGAGRPARAAAAATTVVPRPGERTASARPPLQASRPARGRKARLALRRLDPWSVFVTSLMLSLFLAVVTVVAAFVLYQVLGAAGVTDSINKGVTDVKGGADPLTQGRFLGGAALLAAVNVVLLTALATLSSLLYNLVATFTGGLELTLAERD